MQPRNTKQLKVIQDQLTKLDCHPTAEEVYNAVHADYPTISKATVYRSLNKLAASGEATKVLTISGADHFDHQTHPHYHVVCSRCGKVDDVQLAPLASVEQQASHDGASGYVITGHTLQFSGLCPACQKQQLAV